MSFFKMTKTILQNLRKKPATRLYPIARREFKPNYRGKIAINLDLCVYCSLCQKKCPTNAITVNMHDKNWTIDSFKCITCGYCVEACPKKCLQMENQYTTPAVAMWEETFQDREIPDQDEHYWE